MATKTTHVIPATNGYYYGVPSLEVKGQSRATPKMKKRRPGVDRIRVCIRKRPLSKQEGKTDRDVVQTDPHRGQVLVKEEKLALDLSGVTALHKFRFDEVFPEDIANKAVYERTVKSSMPFVIQGGRATCFAFGQTGSGKTHTLLGDSTDRGLYQYAAEDLFDLLRPNPDGLFVWISYFEIYCGQIYDLLNKRERIKALENDKSEVCITGVNEVPVSSPYILSKFIDQGNNVRSQGSSGVNSMSSRSHAVLQIQLKDVTENKLGRLSIIDLAGSERACDRGDPDKATRLEGAEINTSLLSLKECIRALDQEHPHKPFRQSKLTHILRDSLIGGARTCMIASVSPGNGAIEDTLNTLKYAERVKEINRLASNSPIPSSYTPKGFSPHNTSTPMKGQRGDTPATTPVRKHRGGDGSGRRKSRDRSKKVDSPNAKGDEMDRIAPVGESRTPEKSIKRNSGRGDISEYSPAMKGGGIGCNDGGVNKKGSVHSTESSNGFSSPIRREVVPVHDKMILRNGGQLFGENHRPESNKRDNVVKENGPESEGETSTGERLSTKGGRRGEMDRRSEAVRKFLSNSLPIWEDQVVQEDRIFAPSLSFAWEVDNPHYVISEGAENPDQTGFRNHSDVGGSGGTTQAGGDNSEAGNSRKSWKRLDQKEQGLMRFENPRYFRKSPRSQNKHGGTVGGCERAGGVDVKLQTTQCSELPPRSLEGLMKNGDWERDLLAMDEDKGDRSPSRILTENTLELLAEVDKCMLTMSLRSHSEEHGHHGAEAMGPLSGEQRYSGHASIGVREQKSSTEGSTPPPDGEYAQRNRREDSGVTGGTREQQGTLDNGSMKRSDTFHSKLEPGSGGNGDVTFTNDTRMERTNSHHGEPSSDWEGIPTHLDASCKHRGNGMGQSRSSTLSCGEGTVFQGGEEQNVPSSSDGGSTPQRSAFFRETLQPLTREWQLVQNNESPPVSEVKMRNKLDDPQVGVDKTRDGGHVVNEEFCPEGRSSEAYLSSKEVFREPSGIGNSPLDLRVKRNRSVDNQARDQNSGGIPEEHTDLRGSNEGWRNCQGAIGNRMAPAIRNDGLDSLQDKGRDGIRDKPTDERVMIANGESGRNVNKQGGTQQGMETGGVLHPKVLDSKIGGRDHRNIVSKGMAAVNQVGERVEMTAGLATGVNVDRSDDMCSSSEYRSNRMITPDDLKFGRFPLARARSTHSGSCVKSGGGGLEVCHSPLSPILEQRSEDGQLGESERDRDRGCDERFEGSPSPPGRPNSALERSTVCTGLTTTTATPNKMANTRELILSSHQECLERIQQMCDAGWEIINRLDQGQVDIPEYVAEAAAIVDRQRRCIETFQDQLAVYNTYTEQDLYRTPVRDTLTGSDVGHVQHLSAEQVEGT